METKHTSITFKAKVTPIEVLNNEFSLCKVYVQGLGKNRNGSYMSKENVEKYLPTLNYCPVVGHIFKYTDNEGVEHIAMGGHDYKIDENWKIVDLTVPYGVVVNDSFGFETINEYGTDVEYLTANAILWTGRYPELKDAIYSDDFWFNQSMEININQYRPLEEDSNYTELLEWSYSALCMLGKADDKDSPAHTEPCFISSKVIPVDFSKNDFNEVMNEMKEKILLCFNGINLNCSKEGGNTLDEKLLILEKFNKTIEDLDFSIEDFTVEELENKMVELFGEPASEPVVPETDIEPDVDPENIVEPIVEPETPVEPVAFSATYKEKRKALNEALDPIIVRDAEGYYVEETYFYVEDFNDEYVFVERCYWTRDDYKCNHGRFSYTYDESTMSATITGEFEEMVQVWLTLEEKAQLDSERENYEAIKTEYAEYKENHSVLNSDFEILKEYKEEKEANERKVAADAIFSEYESRIGEKEEFKELKGKYAEYSLDELKKECLCIVGMYSMVEEPKATVSENTTIKFSFEPKEDDDEPYGGLMKKYLKR